MRLKDNVGGYFGFAELGDVVGVEIEIESEYPFPPREATRYYWTKEHDGSLRGGHSVEYVLRNPMKREKVRRALDILTEVLDKHGTNFDDSVRAGTHVHINVRDLTFLEMWSFVTCWYVLEELLIYTMCGEGRVGNHFCLSAEDADTVVFEVRNVLRGKNILNLGRDNIRYSALNFVALGKYGSLEFRAMRTPRNFDEIKLWIDVLLAIKENSKLFPNPRHVVENFSFGGEKNFLRAILGNENARIVMDRDREGWTKKLRKGVRIAQDIAYARDDWEKEPIKKKKKVEKMKNMEEFAAMFDIEVGVDF